MIPSIYTLPHRLRLRKSCGKELNARIFFVCSRRGGFAAFDEPITHRRQKRGIVDECCHKPCSDADLTSYCNHVEPDFTSEESENVSQMESQRVEPNLVI
jgi:hypothetical protein